MAKARANSRRGFGTGFAANGSVGFRRPITARRPGLTGVVEPWSALVTTLAVAMVAIGCSPSLTTLTPARTTPAGHLSIVSGVEQISTGGEHGALLEAAADLPNEDRTPTEQVVDVADATSAALVHAPALGYRIALAYGVSQRVEIGLSTSLNAVRGSFRYQFLRAAPGFYGVIGLGATAFLSGYPVGQITDEITVESFDRQELDLPLHFGYSGQIFHLWGGPKAVFARYGAEFGVCARRSEGRCARWANAQMDGTAAYLGGQIGIAIGYRRAWLAAELTVARLGMNADMAVRDREVNEERTLGLEGLVVSPAVGGIFWF